MTPPCAYIGSAYAVNKEVLKLLSERELPMENYLIRISLFVALTCVWQSANAGEVKLLPASNSLYISMAVLKRATQDKLHDVVIFDKQSFHVEENKIPIGTLVSGRGMLSDQGRENSTCFVAIAKQGGLIELVLTIGVNDWEAESCMDVNAIGLISNKTVAGRARVVIVYKTASPSAGVHEPVVLSWDIQANRLEIDLESSKKASLAGATTILGIRKALKK